MIKATGPDTVNKPFSFLPRYIFLALSPNFDHFYLLSITSGRHGYARCIIFCWAKTGFPF